MVTQSPVARPGRSNYKRAGLEPATYSLAQVAALIGVSYSTCHLMAQAGTLPIEPIRIGRVYKFTCSDVHRLLGIDDRAERGVLTVA